MTEVRDKQLSPPYPSVLDLVGGTPMVELSRFDTGLCRLFVKAREPQSGRLDQGSHCIVHDRSGGTRRLAAARRHHRRSDRGKYRPGLAQVGIPKGTGSSSWCPTRCRARRSSISGPSAPSSPDAVRRGKGDPEYYQDMAEKIARETPGAFYVNQFANPANPAPIRRRPVRKSGSRWRRGRRGGRRRRLRRHADRARRFFAERSPRPRWFSPTRSGRCSLRWSRPAG